MRGWAEAQGIHVADGCGAAQMRALIGRCCAGPVGEIVARGQPETPRGLALRTSRCT